MMKSFAPLFNVYAEAGSANAADYLKGLMGKLPGKNMERMADVIDKAKQQNLQQFISDSPWSSREVWDAIASRVNARLGGHRDSMLVIDESCESKQGKCSAGVARQHNGRLGKIDNCQVGVYSALVCGVRSSLVGARLFLPDEWTDSQERCEKAGIPEAEIKPCSKIDLARELITQAVEQDLSFRLISLDSFYGRDQGLLMDIAKQGFTYVADIPTSTLVWSKKPKGKERPKSLSEVEAQRVDVIKHPVALSVHVRPSENRPVRVKASAQRVWTWPAAAAEPIEQWLLVTEQTDVTMKYSLSNAPSDTRLEVLVRWQGQRFFIEQTFKNAKSHVGMSDYQVRKYVGWEHHMSMVGLALLFLLEERMDHAESIPLLSPSDITEIIHWHFCTQPSREAVIDQIQQRHRRRERVSESKHRVDRREQRKKDNEVKLV